LIARKDTNMAKELAPKPTDDPAYKITAITTGYIDDPELPGEPYITQLNVNITQEWYDEESDDGVEREVGSVEGFIYHVGLAINDRRCIVEVAEGLGEEVPEFCSAVIERGANNWRKSIERQFNYRLLNPDLLAITRVKIEEGHRGRRLGLLATLRVMQMFGGNCGLTIIRPNGRRYWGRLGFERLGRSDFCGFPCSKPLPSLRSFIAAESEGEMDD
jgi:hypothetical protein